MNILILGSGGREHALAWKIKQSPLCWRLFIAPGNAGTLQCGQNINIDVNNFAAIKDFCIKKNVELVVVGPEDPLVNGIYDFLHNNKVSPAGETWRGIVIGPSAAGAQLEGSKSFSKHFMQRHNIPTATYAEFNEFNYQEGKQYISQHTLPIVLKADGLAAGKGVIICNTHDEALAAFEDMIVNKQFGKASAKVVIEEFLQGIEVSVFVLTDGVGYKIIGHAKDYKRIGEGDTGLNTGGMGCVSPVPFVDDIFMAKVEERIINPTIKGLQTEQLEYKGFVFIGLINVNSEPYVIEYNCRMGDPETEVVLPRLKNDLVEMFLAMHKGELDKVKVEFDERAAATIVAVSGGYPGEYKKGIGISFDLKDYAEETGIRNDSDLKDCTERTGTGMDSDLKDYVEETRTRNDSDLNNCMENITDKTKKSVQSFQSIKSLSVLVFHAGTKQVDDEIVTNGGRVLAVTAYGENIAAAVSKSKTVLEKINFEGMSYRKDIGYEFETYYKA